MDLLLSVSKSAELLSVSPWTIRAWINQGKIASVKLGSRRLVRQSELERIIGEATVPALALPRQTLVPTTK